MEDDSLTGNLLASQPSNNSLIGQPPSQISLSLTSGYARSWGLWEGLRELVQNWHDGVYDALDELIKHGQVPLGTSLSFQQVYVQTSVNPTRIT